jgi:hypothetical protein
MISVQFQNDEIGTKGFVYPESFEKFLKAENPAVQSSVLKELHTRHERLQLEREEREHKVTELREEIKATSLTKKKTTRAPRKKKVI